MDKLIIVHMHNRATVSDMASIRLLQNPSMDECPTRSRTSTYCSNKINRFGNYRHRIWPLLDRQETEETVKLKLKTILKMSEQRSATSVQKTPNANVP